MAYRHQQRRSSDLFLQCFSKALPNITLGVFGSAHGPPSHGHCFLHAARVGGLLLSISKPLDTQGPNIHTARQGCLCQKLSAFELRGARPEKGTAIWYSQLVLFFLSQYGRVSEQGVSRFRVAM